MTSLTKLVALISLYTLIILTGCSSNIETKVEKSSEIGKSSSCSVPPNDLIWLGKSYVLLGANTSAEPGMKFGFLNCENGRYSLSDNDGPNQIIVYDNGESQDHKDLILISTWGRVLYTMQ